MEDSADAEPIPGENGRRTMTDKRDAPLIALCEAIVRARSLEEALGYELIASRAELLASMWLWIMSRSAPARS